MPLRDLQQMWQGLALAIEGDETRAANVYACHDEACAIGRRLPLVHRTCKPDAEMPWTQVLDERAFAALPPCTGSCEQAAGIPRAAYFFLGCGAYPEGLVGFVLEAPSVLLRYPASYTPIDTGSLGRYVAPRDPAQAASWDDDAKARFLLDHLGQGREVTHFAGPYLAAHFEEPMTYVQRGQYSTPDFPAYHGLESTNGDRRAWTIEVQVHANVRFGRGGANLTEIVVARPSLVEELPDDLKGFARVAMVENEVLDSIAEGITKRIGEEIA